MRPSRAYYVGYFVGVCIAIFIFSNNDWPWWVRLIANVAICTTGGVLIEAYSNREQRADT